MLILAAAALVVIGVALISWPVALIVTGAVLGALAYWMDVGVDA